jgi:hypothetical protein
VPHAKLAAAVLSIATLFGAVHTAPSLAAGAPHWSIAAESVPTYFSAGDESDAYVLIVRNDGGAPTKVGETVHITDVLPSGVTPLGAEARGEAPDNNGEPRYKATCSVDGETDTASCKYGEGEGMAPVLPGAVIEMVVTVSIAPGLTKLDTDVGTVEGGGAASASVSETPMLSQPPAPPAPFGLSLFDVETVGEDGEADAQAGSHPYELTTTLAFTVAARESNGEKPPTPLAGAAPKDLRASLPAGVVGNPMAVPRCSQQAFLELEKLNCPLDTQVGTIKVFFYGTTHTAVFPVYDVVPPLGEPAELGFSIGSGHVPLFLRVRGGGGSGLTASLEDIPEEGPLQGAVLTLWGLPAASSHNLEREGTDGDGPLETDVCKPTFEQNGKTEEVTECPSGAPLKPFLTLPTKCQSSPLTVGVEVDSWEQPGPPLERLASEPALADEITGCESLSFSPTLSLSPETTQAGAPSGYTLHLHIPQDESPNALATPALRSATVTLPAGVALSPSVANGLQACSPSQFEPGSPESLERAPAVCPPESQIGTAKIFTPLLSSPLEGQLYVGEPACAPCAPADAQAGRLLHVLLQAQGSGVTVKLEGTAAIDQSTGQVTVSFPQVPQLPFEDVQVTLDGGQNAPLVNPDTCATPLAASSQLTPYSSETPAEPTSEQFTLGGCQAPRFAPTFTAGTTDNQAGAFSPLTLTLQRSDADEALQTLSATLPPGLLAMLSKVTPCPQVQAQAGACGPASLIGTASVGAGPGPEPLFLNGSVYLTGPYEGAPYGLSIVVPALAGPFDLGQVVVGARIRLDPASAALTIASDLLPQSLDGIPLQLKTIHLDIGREGFVFNPTNCAALAIAATATSVQGASAALSSRFQAANCATLPFKPKLTAQIHAQTSKAAGAYLHVRIEGSPGQANIAALKVELPKRLATRLGTLQHSCRSSAFDANPAACPASSVVGSASVTSPALPYPLIGPVYAISNGEASLPAVAIVLQGDGLTVRLEGQSSLAHGVTAETFRSLPDVPVTRVDLKLPSGPHSLLAASLPASSHGSLCGMRLAMPTEITGQNGAVVKQNTSISIAGCRAPHRHSVRRAPKRR